MAIVCTLRPLKCPKANDLRRHHVAANGATAKDDVSLGQMQNYATGLEKATRNRRPVDFEKTSRLIQGVHNAQNTKVRSNRHERKM